MINYIPVIIVGAGRSGTNLLSWIIEQDPGYINLYENRYIWNYGQKTLSHDIRFSHDVTPRISNYINKYYDKKAQVTGKNLIDKTPSNIFRVGFIHKVMPEARIIHIIRDGRDNVLSRKVEWYGGKESYRISPNGSRERSARLPFLRRRITHLWKLISNGNLPISRWPDFIKDNTNSFLYNLVTSQPRRYAERFPGMREVLQVYGINVAASIQWREGVMHAIYEGRKLPRENYIEVRYEDLLTDIDGQWERIAKFLGIEVEGPSLDYMHKNIKCTNINKWKTVATNELLSEIEQHIRPTLEYLGYVWEQ